MAKRVFYSFHFDNDAWRAAQVRGMGSLEGNEPVSPNDWESVKRGGDAAIEEWIASEMKGRTSVVVLVGSQTAYRPWVQYEIRKAWNDGLGLVGIRIHNLLNQDQATSVAGTNPFSQFTVNNSRPLSDLVRLYEPSGSTSKAVYADIKDRLDSLVAEAIQGRK